jgi:Rrf2 family iron-sulfur cluster assembly transcriptional regulator
MTHDLWDELSRHIELFLGQISLRDIITGNVLGRSSPPKVLEVK